MEVKLFHYTAEFLPDEDDEERYKGKISHGVVTDHGVIAATAFGKAVDRVVAFYGENCIVQVSIYELENPLCNDELSDMIAEDENK